MPIYIRQTFRLATVVLMFFLLAPNAHPYHFLNHISGSNVIFRSWKDVPVEFRVDGGTLAGGDGYAVFLDACDVWNSIEGVFNICGNSVQLDVDITASNFDDIVSFTDGIVYIVFDETGEILSSLGLPPNAVGVTLGVFISSTGEIVDGAVILNGTYESGANVDHLATAVHELGHIWGLAHIPTGGVSQPFGNQGLDPISFSAIPVMYPFTNPVDDRTGRELKTDDKAAMRILYPQ